MPTTAAAVGPCRSSGSEFVVPCEMVLPAIGQVASSEPAGGLESVAGRRPWSADPATLQTAREGLFAGGDVVSGGGSVIEAIAARPAGRRRHRPPPRRLRRSAPRRERQPSPRLGRGIGAGRVEARQSRCCPSRERLGDFREVVCGITHQGRVRRGQPMPAVRSREAAVLMESIPSGGKHERIHVHPRWAGSRGTRGPDHPPGGAGPRRGHPPSLPRSAACAHGSMPPLPGRDRGRGGHAHVLHAAGHARHGRAHRHRRRSAPRGK